MGRIKSLMIKKAAKQLIASGNVQFDETFNTNKRALSSSLPSKPIRNKVAGYIARLKRMEKEAKVPKKPKIEEVPVQDYEL